MIYDLVKKLQSYTEIKDVIAQKMNDDYILFVTCNDVNVAKDIIEKEANDFSVSFLTTDKRHLKAKLSNKLNELDERDRLLKCEGIKNIAEFRRMPIDMIEKLVCMKNGIDLDFKPNYAPKQSVFVNWIRQHPSFTASGFITSRNRDDCGVYIDSIEGKLSNDDNHTLNELKNTFYDASAISVSIDEDNNTKSVCCWYD